MYSAVLVLALTAGNDSVDFGRNRCNGGGCSATVCSSSYGCSHSSCSHGGLFNRGHGCSTGYGCSVSHGCSGYVGCSSSHGCSSRGGLFHRNRGGNCCCAPVVVCSGACSGGVIIDGGTTPKVMPKSEKVPEPKKTSATIVVSLPAEARLFVDGNATTSTSETRTLVTPALEVGSTYLYTFRAEVGTEVRTQQVAVRGGQVSNVQFNFSTQTVASR